ncbi:MAG: M14 family zinc carboxypeptidase [Anaerolineales bacterium]
MRNNRFQTRRGYFALAILCMIALILPMNVMAKPLAAPGNSGPWWDVTPEPENPSPYYDSILYSEIAPRLREIEVNSNRVQVNTIGQSAGGRNMFLVTLSAPEAMGRLGQYKAIRETMLKNPEKAQEMIDKFGDFKVPFLINASIHGNEYTGVDAAIRLIETLAYDNSPEVMDILNNVILLVNVVQNPDGRVMGTRTNANGIDINRDFITQSQPEARATVKIFTEWNPMVVLDLHGFVNPMLIEPCTPPHNPNYEYDLYIKWAFEEAEAMEAELFANTGFSAQIPFRDFGLGWDDWPPTYVPMYGMYHGSYGHTLETSYRDERGVDAHYWAVWGALKFAAQNRQAMVHDQIEIFRRGFLDLPQMRIPDEILDQTQYDQYNDLTIQDFPAAYVIPADEPFQLSSHQAARLVNFLLFNDIQVDQASQGFMLNGKNYPAGSYVVWMDQPKRGLANTILESGPDLSSIEGLYFYSPPSVWSNPLLWGVYRDVMEEKIDVKTNPINNADPPRASAEGGKAEGYAFEPTSLQAFQAANDLLARGENLFRAPDNRFVIGDNPSLANELANQYALEVSALKNLPADLVQLHSPRIAVYSESGTEQALRTLGFSFTSLSRSDINSGAITNYDIFIDPGVRWDRLNDDGRASLSAFFASGGDFIGLGYSPTQLAIAAGILDAEYSVGDGNAIVKLDYSSGDALAAGFWQQDYAFVYYPVWFSDLGADVEVTASYAGGDFLVSGFWPGWMESGAAGQAAIVHQSSGERDVSVLGIDATFRGHPENAFRLLGNAIFSSQ